MGESFLQDMPLDSQEVAELPNLSVASHRDGGVALPPHDCRRVDADRPGYVELLQPGFQPGPSYQLAECRGRVTRGTERHYKRT